ncbi:MAG: glycosyltransferase family 4 protein [Acidobacteriota bacterium]
MGAPGERPLSVLLFGTYESTFPRSKTIVQGLRAAGAEVAECHVPLWELTRDKTGGFAGKLGLVKLAFRILWAYVRLLGKYLRAPRYDALVVGYMGYLDVFLARVLALRRRLVLSPVVSLYETVVSDRKMVRSKLVASLVKGIDRWGCRLADVILLETSEYIRYYGETFSVPAAKFARIFLGADETNFVPRGEEAARRGDGKFLVFFYGKFTPLQGIPYILRAASRLLSERDVAFEIVGSGQLSAAMKALAAELGLGNVTFIDWVDYGELPSHIARADLCLGIFGDTEKAARGVPVKAFDAMAMGRPIVNGDSPASREVFTHGESAWLVPMGDDAALADAILHLRADPALRGKLAAGARRAFEERYSQARIGRALVEAIGARRSA